MFSSLAQPGPLKALYAANALWHTSAFIHFGFKQPFMMAKLTTRRASSDPSVRAASTGDPWHHDIMSYLGGMNTSLALLALLRLYALARPSSRALSTGTAGGDLPLDVTALLVLGLANGSQAWMNFRTALKSDRWIMGKGLDRITVLDAVFVVLDWAAVMGRMAVA